MSHAVLHLVLGQDEECDRLFSTGEQQQSCWLRGVKGQEKETKTACMLESNTQTLHCQFWACMGCVKSNEITHSTITQSGQMGMSHFHLLTITTLSLHAISIANLPTARHICLKHLKNLILTAQPVALFTEPKP